jgi:hypothetical protein
LLSGEVRCELNTLTPLLVGWERQEAGKAEGPFAVPCTHATDDNSIQTEWGVVAKGKSVLCPLRAPAALNDKRPVLLPGDSIKGLLRHELGALCGAPMERVAERSYSYRPNTLRTQNGDRLVPRLARVLAKHVELRPLDPADPNGPKVRVPLQLDLLPLGLRYDAKATGDPNTYNFAPPGAPYCGGLGAGDPVLSNHALHACISANPDTPTITVHVPTAAQEGLVRTVRHLADLEHGHFSRRHPHGGDREVILRAAGSAAFQPGALVWVEWDTVNECIVSLGWHYYYRWAYVDSVRQRRWHTAAQTERQGLLPLVAEQGAVPAQLTAVRRLFGYVHDRNNQGTHGIGSGDHEQLMGRISVNTAVEVLNDSDTDKDRFLPPKFLRELGLPRPSAVEHYLRQPYHPQPRPNDQATLVTYGDAAGYDASGELAGRKFYLDRADAYSGHPCEDASDTNRLNERSTLAIEASRPGRTFRFAVTYRDLEPKELAALLVALCPNQFAPSLGWTHADGYCSKLGYARPLGWGSVRIEAKRVLQLTDTDSACYLAAPPDMGNPQNLVAWVGTHLGAHLNNALLGSWLGVHRCKHPDAADYPRDTQKQQTITYHTQLRARHSRGRRRT